MLLNPMYFVVLNWNLSEETIICVESVLRAGVLLDHVIVVDNGSTEAAVETLVDFGGAELILVRSEKNLGFAGGMNLGIQCALELGAASVLLLNNDTVIDQAMVKALLDAGAVLNNPGILGPAIYYYDNPERIWKLGDIQYRYLPMPWSLEKVYRRDITALPPFQVDYLTGCAMLIRREVFEKVGLLDEQYFMYFEDADFCRRARDAGFEIWCVPQAKMWHKVSLTAQRDKPSNRYHRALNQVRFYHAYKRDSLKILREIYIILKILKTMLGDILHGDWNLIGPLYRGTLDGYQEQWGRIFH